MKTNSFRAFVTGPLLFALAVGLALTTSGCIVDNGPGYGGNCQSDLTVPWQIQSSAGGSVTCDAAGAATVVINIDGVNYPQPCPVSQTEGFQDIILQSNNGTYNVTVSLEDAKGNNLATPMMITMTTNGCASYTTPSPAILVLY